MERFFNPSLTRIEFGELIGLALCGFVAPNGFALVHQRGFAAVVGLGAPSVAGTVVNTRHFANYTVCNTVFIFLNAKNNIIVMIFKEEIFLSVEFNIT